MAYGRFSKLKAIGKGLGPAIGAYFAAHMAGVNLGDIIADPEGQLPVIASTFIAGLIPVIINVIKHRGKPGNPIALLPFLLLLGGAALVPGCVTTTHPDGTVVQSVDLTTAWQVYDDLQARRVEREAAKERARQEKDAALVASIEREIAALDDEIAAAWGRIPVR